MKVSTEKMENCQVALTIEAEAGELDKSLSEAYHRLVNKASIPGFRKGKAPRAILEQHLGKGALLEDALERLIPQLYKEAIESQEIKPIAEPHMEITQTDPVVLKAIVPLKPTIKLGDYHGIKLEPESVEISDEQIEAAIEQIRQEQAILSPVDRPVQFDDVITMNIEATIEGKPFLNHKDMVYEVSEKSTFPLPGFNQNLAGTEKNKEKAFSLNVPADYRTKELAGKQCVFKITVAEIKEKNLPQIDDEFAQSAGYDNLAAMKEKVFASLKAEAEEISRQKLRQKALDDTIELSEVDYPPVLEDREIDRLLEDESQRFGFKEIQDYLNRTNKTKEEYREKLRPIAKKRIIHTLVLDKIAEEEKVEIDSSEVDNKVEEIMKDAKDKERMQQFFALPQVRESIEQSLRTEKTIARLVQIVSGYQEE
ncbi:MAG: trigger factor [Dehalococcoidia bacterium]|nr:trigger factor [Dehalococcoidia bacterium]